MEQEKDLVEIWTDGASKGNPGPGGWGAFLKWQGKTRVFTKELCGGNISCTNNQMELTAPTEALRLLKRPCKVILHTDSQYVQKGITMWIHGWKKNNWRTKAGEPVKNAELWKELERETHEHEIEWKWVKGHAGIEGNEMADILANRGVEEALKKARK